VNKSVILDACPDCRGIWLDGGEFEKLFAAK
jgi:Zn-finger nucleic acid-binding protein